VAIYDGYQVGDECRAISPDDFRWYSGSVVEVLGGGRVKWDDPDGGDETLDVDAEHMQRSLVFKGYKPNDKVLARHPDNGQMYDATVVRLNDDGTFQVRWSDPFGGPEETSPVHSAGLKYPPIPFEKLAVGQKYKGIVKSMTEFGAWVDIGAVSRGLLHISRIAKHRVHSVQDVLDEGQEVDVWICGLREGKKFGLTMVEGRLDAGRVEDKSRGDLEAFVGISPDEWLVGVVQGIRPYGVFVTLTRGGSTSRGLVHVSRLSDGFVEDVEGEFRVGQEVKVRVIDVDVTAGKMGLTMQSLQPSSDTSRSKLEATDLSVFKYLDPSEWVTGVVVGIVPFGAFVDVRAPQGGQTARGLLHIYQGGRARRERRRRAPRWAGGVRAGCQCQRPGEEDGPDDAPPAGRRGAAGAEGEPVGGPGHMTRARRLPAGRRATAGRRAVGGVGGPSGSGDALGDLQDTF
ncbi:unnamed protein product, partial [Prorocentrum cordatum]